MAKVTITDANNRKHYVDAKAIEIDAEEPQDDVATDVLTLLCPPLFFLDILMNGVNRDDD